MPLDLTRKEAKYLSVLLLLFATSLAGFFYFSQEPNTGNKSEHDNLLLVLE